MCQSLNEIWPELLGSLLCLLLSESHAVRMLLIRKRGIKGQTHSASLPIIRKALPGRIV